jgi:hypothetical protein
MDRWNKTRVHNEYKYLKISIKPPVSSGLPVINDKYLAGWHNRPPGNADLLIKKPSI